MMTRLMRELAGEFGDYWQRDAEQRLRRVKAELAEGQISIDESGVARNSIGRVVTDEVLELLTLVTDKANDAATKGARRAEVEMGLESYRARQKPHSGEQVAEMRAAFGEGTTVVDVITGEKIKL